MPQYPMLLSPEYSVGSRVLFPKMPQYQILLLPESEIRNQTQMGENNMNISLETSHQRGLARPVQKGVSLRNQQEAERKGSDSKGPTFTAQAARILRPTTPQDQGLPSLKSKHDKAVAAFEDMNAIRALCAKYHKNDIYNMDETNLSWEHALYPALAPGSAKDSSHMTLALCVNSTGSDRLPVWAITSKKRPICNDRLDLRAFGGVWQSSKNLAMTADAMREWLRSFYSHIGKRRSILLLLDNHIAHKKGVKSTPPPSNIRIQWLPPGTTSRYQPLNQGINRALKCHYRQIWIKHMFGKLYGGEFMNPVHENVSRACCSLGRPDMEASHSQ